MATNAVGVYVTPQGTQFFGTFREVACMARGLMTHAFPEELPGTRRERIEQLVGRIPDLGLEEKGDEMGLMELVRVTYGILHEVKAADRCEFPGCTKTTDLLRCKACKGVMYCGLEHHRAHWKTHKPLCNAVVAQIGNARAVYRPEQANSAH